MWLAQAAEGAGPVAAGAAVGAAVAAAVMGGMKGVGRWRRNADVGERLVRVEVILERLEPEMERRFDVIDEALAKLTG